MTSTFTVQVTDKTKRIYIPKAVCDAEKISQGDFVEVIIKKKA
jgi:bifunctional DNA-binding transcriptional regulator/antitoxin component of YhaV-PrlF toxin-antitoxin module